MFFIDIPYALAQQEMIVLAQKSSETSRQADYGFRICKEVPYNMEDSRTAVRILAPAGALGAYLGNRSGQIIEASEFRNLTLLKAPIHGDLTPEKDYPGVFWYDPTYGYDGRDSAAFQVEYKGKIYRVVYDLFISRFVAEPSTLCPEPHLYKLKPVLNAIEFPGFTFSNLSAASVAQTTGTGSSAKITLDEDAAGHGWFIDYTPYLNEEWLPTSNPCEWQAKPGSDAEGKMDLLSVLLHEYGHVLGLEHTADAHDFMSTTLQPGVRRLPSASELQQMANLVAQLKGEMGLTSTTPQEPDTPLPYTPLPVSVGLTAFLASRQRRDTETPKITRHEIAANPKLTDADFKNGGSGWSTLGNVVSECRPAVVRDTKGVSVSRWASGHPYSSIILPHIF